MRPRRLHGLGLTLLVFSCAGCAETPPAVPPPVPNEGPLVNPFDWMPVPAESDPFITDDPELVVCKSLDVGPESLGGVWVYSVQTGECNWHTITQPSTLAMAPGDLLQLRVWHFQLLADGPATAHVHLTIDGEMWATADEQIPSAGRMIVFDMPVTRAVPEGTDVVFHVDNHGINSWHLVDLILNPKIEDADDAGFADLDGGVSP